MRTALTIAGSDSGGGAGIQADIKTMSALGVYSMSVITAVTAQNTQEVRSVQNIDTGIIRDQMEAVFDDIRVDAVKIGMLSTSETIEIVAEGLAKYNPKYIVLDPVMISKGGHALLSQTAVDTLIRHLLPHTTLITPNIPEAEVFVGSSIQTEEEMHQACLAIHKLGPTTVLLKGGHLEGDANDLYYDGENFHWLKSKRILTKNTHGTGCTLSSAITANLAKGATILEAVTEGKRYITTAINNSLSLGSGHGPTNHFYELYEKASMQTK